MTRVEQIKKAATENPSNFIEGAEWADSHPQSHWISVEDSLPPVGAAVLCYLCKDSDGEERYQIMRRLDDHILVLQDEHRLRICEVVSPRRDENGFQIRAIETEPGVFEDMSPIYWMPLPCPPTKE